MTYEQDPAVIAARMAMKYEASGCCGDCDPYTRAIDAYGRAVAIAVLREQPCQWRTEDLDAEDLERCDPAIPCHIHRKLDELEGK